jgi:hypothetical protein
MTSCSEQQPTNSSLAYLRGRICTRRHEALPYYEKALRLGYKNNAFAHNATAFVCAGTGDWPTALKTRRARRRIGAGRSAKCRNCFSIRNWPLALYQKWRNSGAPRSSQPHRICWLI